MILPPRELTRDNTSKDYLRGFIVAGAMTTGITYGMLAATSGEIIPSRIIDYHVRHVQELRLKEYNRKVEACQEMLERAVEENDLN